MMDNRHSYMLIVADSVCMGQFSDFKTLYNKHYKKEDSDGYDYRCHILLVSYYLWCLIKEEQGGEEDVPVPKPLEDLRAVGFEPWDDLEFQKSVYRIRQIFPARIEYLKYIMSKHGAQYWYATNDYMASVKYDGVP